MIQTVASLSDDSWSIIMLLESPIMLLENIYSTGITHDDRHLWPEAVFLVMCDPSMNDLWAT
jgi:hypothetical protein